MWEWTAPASTFQPPLSPVFLPTLFPNPRANEKLERHSQLSPPPRLPHSSSVSLHVEGTSAPNKIQPLSVTHSLCCLLCSRTSPQGLSSSLPCYCFLLSTGLVLSPHTWYNCNHFKGKIPCAHITFQLLPVFLPCPYSKTPWKGLSSVPVSRPLPSPLNTFY